MPIPSEEGKESPLGAHEKAMHHGVVPTCILGFDAGEKYNMLVVNVEICICRELLYFVETRLPVRKRCMNL